MDGQAQATRIRRMGLLTDSSGELVLERKRIIHHKANNQHYKQNELMWQAAREEIPI